MDKKELIKAIGEIEGVFRVYAEEGRPEIHKKSGTKILKVIVYFDHPAELAREPE